MMEFLDRKTAITQMNRFGHKRCPFLFIVDYQQKNTFLKPLHTISPTELVYNLNGKTNAEQPKLEKKLFHLKAYPQAEDTYRHAFGIVEGHLHRGNSYLVNLTCSTPVETNESLENLFYRAKALYKLYMPGKFLVFSPEIFVRIRQNSIYSYPMKGTIDASLPDARRQILDNPKEAAEHATIVDLIRNDLSQVATHVHVPRYRYIDEIQTHTGKLLQVSSEIEGQLPANWHEEIGSILFSLLPAGSITGAPKKKTQAIIREAETYDRNFYTGIMGYYDGHQVDSAVMIRFIEQQGDRLFFKSGGGITAQSNWKDEYNEMIQKIYVPVY